MAQISPININSDETKKQLIECFNNVSEKVANSAKQMKSDPRLSWIKQRHLETTLPDQIAIEETEGFVSPEIKNLNPFAAVYSALRDAGVSIVKGKAMSPTDFLELVEQNLALQDGAYAPDATTKLNNKYSDPVHGLNTSEKTIQEAERQGQEEHEQSGYGERTVVIAAARATFDVMHNVNELKLAGADVMSHIQSQNNQQITSGA